MTFEQAKTYFEELLASNSRNEEARFSLGVVLSRRKAFEPAISVLKTGLALHQNDRFGQAIAAVLLAQYNELLKVPNSESRRLRALREALTYDPESKSAMQRLAFFGEESGSTPETRKQAIEVLEGLIATGQQNAIAHLAIGTKAWQSGDEATAELHLERAYQIDQSLTVVANNYAWVLANKSSANLEQALAIVNKLVAKHPDVASFRDTRGRILMKTGTWNEALIDMEFVLQSNPSDAEIHGALEQIYMNLTPRQEGLSRKHAKLKQLLRARNRLGNQAE